MSFIKRIVALALVGVMAIGFASCRSQDESALVYGNLSAAKDSLKDGRADIRSALYLLYLIQADGEFQSKVGEAESTATAAFDYKSQKLENKSYEQWVKDRALQSCAEHAYIELQFQELGLKLTDEQLSSYNQAVAYYWDQYGYSALCELNKISKDTFMLYQKNQYKATALFNYYYGKGGSKEIKADVIKQNLGDNYVLANVLHVSTVDSEGTKMTDAAKAEAKKKLTGYRDELRSGKRTFVAIKKEFDTANGGFKEPETSENGPKDVYATVLGNAKSANPSDYFDKVKALKVGEVEVLEYDNIIMLAVRKNILDDPYYLTTYDPQIRGSLKNEEFTKMIADEAKKLKVDKNEGALKAYSVGKIQYPTQATTAS